ncbi:MAG: ArdC family protein [Chloroflexota bacterium]|nr:ArdC family protein [Chloroflexota bacterium]
MTTTGSPHPTPTPRPTAASGRDANAGEHDEKMQAVLETLERGIAAILDGDAFARYLATLARFHMYSPKNVALIHAQHRDATRVAGYRAWQTLGRQVRKGERGIRIVVPYRARVTPEEESGQDVQIVTGWGIGHVWDVAQTEGEPLALPPIHGALSGDATVAEIVREELTRWLHGQGVTLVRKETGRANGYYLPRAREIAIHQDLTGLRELKTLVHEAAHCAAEHCGGVRWEDAETVAEGAAYTVLSHFGLDTSGYSFGYVAHWARDIAVVRRNLAAIHAVANRLIVAIEEGDACGGGEG